MLSTLFRQTKFVSSSFGASSSIRKSRVAFSSASHGHHEKALPHTKTPATSSDPLLQRAKEGEHLFAFKEGDYIPPTETHAVGDEKDELDFGAFDHTTLKKEFGTRESPVELYTRYDSRIVGCTGSAEHEHEILWHEVRVGKDLLCIECGQCFRCEKIPGFEHLGHHGHDDHHGHEDAHAVSTHVTEGFEGHKHGDGFRYIPPPKTAEQIAKEEAERAAELKKDPTSSAKQQKITGLSYHETEEKTDEGRLTSKSPVFHDRRPQPYKDRQ